jgi:hypothetical protein
LPLLLPNLENSIMSLPLEPGFFLFTPLHNNII